MILYHFTGHRHLESILSEGLNRGEVPLSDREVLNAVNLTISPDPFGHGLDKAGMVVDQEYSREVEAATGIYLPPGTVFANKRAVRIKVKVPSSDRALKQWLPWARKNIDPAYLERLHGAAGAGAKFKTWWLYWGTIPPSAFVTVDVLEPDQQAILGVRR